MNYSGNSIKGRTLIEEPSFEKAVQQLGGARKIDRALDALIGALSNKPDEFPLIPGFGPLRIAKTVPIEWRGQKIPPLRLWFYIGDDGCVYLLWIEESPEEGPL